MVTVTRGEYVKRTYTKNQAEGEYWQRAMRELNANYWVKRVVSGQAWVKC